MTGRYGDIDGQYWSSGVLCNKEIGEQVVQNRQRVTSQTELVGIVNRKATKVNRRSFENTRESARIDERWREIEKPRL